MQTTEKLMDKWNYRVIHHDNNDAGGYYIHEVYYDKNDQIMGWVDPVEPFGETRRELLLDLLHMLMDAIDTPVLSLKELQEGKDE